MANEAYRHLYLTSRWRKKRADHFKAHPYCVKCLPERVPALILNHNPPHRGDLVAFWEGPVEGLCRKHDGQNQRVEMGLKERSPIGVDGWPK